MKRFIVLLTLLFTFSLYAQDKNNANYSEPFFIDDENFIACKVFTENNKIIILLNSDNAIYKGIIDTDELQNFINFIEYIKSIDIHFITENKLDFYLAYNSKSYYVLLSFSSGAGKFDTRVAAKDEKYTLKIDRKNVELSKEVFYELAEYFTNIQNAVKGDN